MKRVIDTRGMVNVGGIKVNGSTKKFYKEAQIAKMEDGWTVCLDGRPIITEDRNRLIVPTASCAAAIAYEWDMQGENIKPFVMPMMSLAATAIDVDRKKIVEKLLKYMDTDSLCYRVESPAALKRMQKKYWDPIINYFRDEHGLEVKVTSGITSLSQPVETKLKLAEFIDDTSKFELACLKAVAEVGYSTMLGIAVVHRKVSVKNAYNAAMAERLFQVRRYGEVTGPYGHGIELEHPRLHISSAINFLSFLEDDHAFSFGREIELSSK
eukprot:CAMPEP_0114508792 /NCGR_PEP_ID=MMETSP0109-20121206/12824_1 /TAXON_ID=29199 /ORGANISM="Chlorarachnion reptans, Strain CCCM449" /LENGTH=267 /DNA_ID=CAMNT_0001687819 /DNA_START=124 /DNA_END=927 /DNA_ORIENTATION=-